MPNVTQGQALEIACRAALRQWPKAGLPGWGWARTKPGKSCPWLVTIGDQTGPLIRVLVDHDGATTIAVA
jgi:hypothetical protein